MGSFSSSEGKGELRGYERSSPKQSEPLWVTCCDSSNIGEVIDISVGGISFEYFQKDWMFKEICPKIVLLDRFKRSGIIRVECIYDIPVGGEESPTGVRRRGVKFLGVSAAEKSEIEAIIYGCCHL